LSQASVQTKESKGETASTEGPELDPFDKLYKHWGEHALAKNLDPPSREKWDFLILRLILSKDPDRIRRYKRIDAKDEWSLGADAYELWRKIPPYMPNIYAKTATVTEFRAYEEAHRGSMRRYMEEQGLLERYAEIIEQQKADFKARARKAQVGIITIGCIGMSILAFTVLTVMLIIALQLLSG
jgi:hypothetical protein